MDSQSQSVDETLSHLTRLSQKPGVQSTLVLSRSDGAIVRASGLLTSTAPGAAENADTNAVASPNSQLSSADGKAKESKGLRSADDVARMVWSFFGSAGGFVEEMMGKEDEVRLLRLRMRRNEIVIVPDSKFILVVIHDTPSA